MGKARGAAAVLHTAPAFSFGHSSSADRLGDDDGPGPGAYYPKGSFSSNNVSCKGGGFGTSGRLSSYGECSQSTTCTPMHGSVFSLVQH